jgi:hypothetical protein
VRAQPKSLPPVQLRVVSLVCDGRADRRQLSILPSSPSFSSVLAAHRDVLNLSRRTRISLIDLAILVPSIRGRIRNHSRARGLQDGLNYW